MTLSVILLMGALALGSARAVSTVAFISNRDGQTQLYLLDVDHGVVHNISRKIDDDSQLEVTTFSWSPTSEHIAYIGAARLNFDLYVLDADGAELRLLAQTRAADVRPSWSPDGAALAYHATTAGLNNDVFTIALDASTPRNLTRTFAGDNHRWPQWSPDGQQIAFYSDADDALDIFVLDTMPGAAPRNLTNGEVFARAPDWSPDGARVAFNTFGILYTVAPDNRHITELLRTEDGFRRTFWSPDGTQLALSWSGNLHIVSADGSHPPRQLTEQLTVAEEITWSPDGSRLVFSGFTASGSRDLYMINADGSGLRRLTTHPALDMAPAWRP
ncbi:MAG: TolB family protein [Chloroflexi bacterium]|nr:TolB family protein [Chloroflexota bacterium]